MPGVATPAVLGSGARGDPNGIALLNRITRAYDHVPAVVITGKRGALSATFTAILQKGIVVGEELVGSTGAGTTTLVAPTGPTTFALNPGASCWQLVASSDPQSLTGIGQHFPPFTGLVRVEHPRPAHGGLLLALVAGGTSSTFGVDAKTLAIRTITVRATPGHVTENVRTLISAPKLASPRPRC